MTVVIAGCGDLGTEAGLRFAATGHRVVGLRRHPEVLPEGIEGRTMDLAHEIPDVPRDTAIVVLALTPDMRTDAGYRHAYLDAPAHMLDGLEHAGAHPRRILLVSSSSVYGAVDDGRLLDEDSPVAPRPGTGEIVHAGEQSLRRRAPEAIVLRLSGLYGPGRGRLQRQVREGTAGTGPERWTNRIHRDDAAAAIVHLTRTADGPADLYIGTDEAPVPRSEVMAFLARAMGADPAGSAPPHVGEQRAPPAAGKRLSNERLLDSGFRFTYPTYREGYRAVLEGGGSRHP